MNFVIDRVVQVKRGGFQVLKRIVLSAAFLISVGVAPALAQTPHIDASIYFGWTFSDGVSGQAVRAQDGNIYDRLDPKDSGSWGFSIGALVGEQAEVGFMYGHQFSTLVAGGTTDKELGDLGINNYHGYFGYNFAPHDAKVIPFIYGGLGATNFTEVKTTQANGVARTLPGETQFSTTWGGGVKFFPSPKIGVRAGLSWTPTYIKSDAVGWWCDPYWGCYLVGNAQYANQFGFNGGVSFRF